MGDLTWFGCLLLAYWLVNVLIYIGMIGRQMRFTAGAAAFAVCLYSALTWGLFTVGANH